MDKSLPTTLETIGQPLTTIPVELSTRFLEHFSEQLYSSPQKAFEELISNGWDAGAQFVDVKISENLSDSNATMSVLDNGISMDVEGLKGLWHIAFSPKQGNPFQFGRHIIGKFGIGKLATYVIAEKLTYICKASDGIIRRVTMDYSKIDKQRTAKQDTLINELDLDVYTIDNDELTEALKTVYGGEDIINLINDGLTLDEIEKEENEDEYGGTKSEFEAPAAGTWTLAILSGLKPTGRDLKIGILKRMLRAALPFGSEMIIRVNGEVLKSSKINDAKIEEWIIGPELGVSEIELEDNASIYLNTDNIACKGQKTINKNAKIRVNSGATPIPYVEIQGIGQVTGKIKLFVDPISGVKSDERGASNGFHINVLGRVINQKDPSFGEKNLSHAAWARFRMTIRADGLSTFLTTDREKFRELNELKIFRAFLRKAFNMARSRYDDDANAALSDGGDLLVRSLGVLSLNPLRNVVAETLETKAPLPELFDESGLVDKEAKLTSWKHETAEKISSALGEIKYEKSDDDSFVKFRLSDNTIIINKEHPFVLEHFRTKAEKELLRTIAMVYLLSDIYALDIGVDSVALRSIREYRDRLMRFRAMQNRKSGTYIAKLLLQTQHLSDQDKLLERVLSDALKYLGFHVKDLGKPGEPEGIASAFPIPTKIDPTEDIPNPPLYSFTFDAKTSKKDVAQTGNLNLDGVAEHKLRYGAKYALVVAPGFSGDAVNVRSEQQQVTLMSACDLGRLLEYTVEFGAIPLTKLEDVFKIHEHEKVSEWVSELKNWLKKSRPITIDIFIKALDQLKGKIPDVLSAATIAYQCRESLCAKTVQVIDVTQLVRGLSILIPDLIGIEGEDKIVVNANAEHVAEAIKIQLEKLHNDAVDVKNEFKND